MGDCERGVHEGWRRWGSEMVERHEIRSIRGLGSASGLGGERRTGPLDLEIVAQQSTIQLSKTRNCGSGESRAQRMMAERSGGR